jgi:hypothetical protein
VGSRRTPFAVKGGGHTGNLGFSSTPGVQIAMARFNDTKVHHEDGTVEAGAGLTWDQVYKAISPGLNVVGGRRPGIGVAGLTLGGGSVAVSHRRIFYDPRYLQDMHSIRVGMDLLSTTSQDLNSSYQTETSNT